MNNGDMPYQCNHCTSTFLHNSDLKRHIMTHTGEKPYMCPICDKAFTLNGNLMKHIRTHSVSTAKKLYKCDLCGIHFKYKEYLETTHLEKCKGKKTRPCIQCDQVFSTRDGLRSHMKTHNISCNYCGKTYSNRGHLTKHIRTHTNSRCPQCGMVLPSGEEPHKCLGKKDIHKSHQCSYCERTFQYKFKLICHMRIHTGEKPHKCSFCERKFRTKGSLKLHIRMHNGEKPYQCKYCEKSFYSSKGCNSHLRSHTGEKPHQCKYCEKSFAWDKYLKAHLKTHTNEQTQGTSLEKMTEFRSNATKNQTDANQSKFNSTNTFNTSPNSNHRVILGMAYRAASMAERVKPNSFKTVFNQYLLANNLPIVEQFYSI